MTKTLKTLKLSNIFSISKYNLFSELNLIIGLKKESLAFHMRAGNALAKVRKCAGLPGAWLPVACVMNSSLKYKFLINYNEPLLLIIMFVWIITGKPILYINYRQTYQLYIIIPVGRNCIGRFGYGPKLIWAEIVMGRNVQ